jgi:hypothetical protein
MSKPTNQNPTESQLSEEEEKRQIDLIVDTQVRIITSAYDKANAYTNLIIIAGYAGFFALWQMTKDYLGRKQALLSALFILVSLIVFIVFEIYKAHFTSRVLRRYQQAVVNPENKNSLVTLVETMNSFERSEMQSALHFVTFWNFTFWVTTITGLAAGIILGAAFVHRLFQ